MSVNPRAVVFVALLTTIGAMFDATSHQATLAGLAAGLFIVLVAEML